MIARLRPFFALSLAGLLVACAHSPSSTLGELPRTPQASIERLLQQAEEASKPEQANLLRLSAADQAYRQQDFGRASSILQAIPLNTLKPAQQVFASTLAAELALARQDAKAALKALSHPSLERLAELPVEQQVRTQLVRARAYEADAQPLQAARERIFIAPLLAGDTARANHAAIWKLVSALPNDQLQADGEADLKGWLELARISKSGSSLEQQQAAIDAWRAQNPQHPAAVQLPEPLVKLKELASQPLTKIALLLPQEGQLAGVARALRDGFLAAQYQAKQAGENPPAIQVYDSSRLTSLDDFYRQAQADGAQLVVGPLEKPLVKQLGERTQLPLATLALNYSDAGQKGPAQLFQFGLAAEDEAREAARRAWADGLRRAMALVPSGEWGDRVLAAFQQSWQASGGTLITAQRIAPPVQMAQQISDMLRLRQSAPALPTAQGQASESVATPAPQNVDFIFLAATPQQAQQIKPTLAFQYAADLPVYATSHVFSGLNDPAQYNDLSGIRFCETPWLLNADDPLRQQVSGQWPQAAGSLGRLYAMGVDAYRLAPRLTQLKALPDSSVEGLSGRLTLSPSQRIERHLPWAEFRNGQVVRLPDSDS